MLTSPELLEKLREIQKDPAMLDRMIEGGAELRKPDSARNVALATLEKVGNTAPIKNRFFWLYWGKKPLRTR